MAQIYQTASSVATTTALLVSATAPTPQPAAGVSLSSHFLFSQLNCSLFIPQLVLAVMQSVLPLRL
jgi:hypothetical protein